MDELWTLAAVSSASDLLNHPWRARIHLQHRHFEDNSVDVQQFCCSRCGVCLSIAGGDTSVAVGGGGALMEKRIRVGVVGRCGEARPGAAGNAGGDRPGSHAASVRAGRGLLSEGFLGQCLTKSPGHRGTRAHPRQTSRSTAKRDHQHVFHLGERAIASSRRRCDPGLQRRPRASRARR